MALALLPGGGALAAEAGLAEAEARAVRAIVEDLIKGQSIPGLSISVVRERRFVFSEGFGSAGESPAGPDSMFRIASVSKPITAVAVLRLAQQGGIDLESPARKYCPVLPERAVEPTVRHLLAHQSGIRHSSDAEDTSIQGDYPRLADSVARFAGDKLLFEPGSDARYTSLGYTVLGCAIETVTGKRYAEAVRELVLDPAEMARTRQDGPELAGMVSPGFRPGKGGKMVASEVVDTRFKAPASGVASTAPDLARFAIALLEQRLLDEDWLRRAWEPQSPDGGEPRTLVFAIGRDRRWGAAFYGTGSMEGTTALLYLVQERGYAVAILANRERFVPEVAAIVPRLNEALLG